ncbi:MAG: hypothetical protein GY720_04870 [bacterium]|nr:hypothetical protein [bacterium]
MKTGSSAELHVLEILCLILAFALPSSGASAATFVVTTETDDNGFCEVDDCALREAILAANVAPGLDTVILPAGLYQLSIVGPADNQSITGDLDILDDLEILGGSSDSTIIVGDGTDRVIQVRHSTVIISGVTITGGRAGASGGGVRATVSDLTIINSAITGNSTTQDGGGVSFGVGEMVLIDTIVNGNSAGAEGFGGGIHIVGITETTVDVINSTLSGNSAFSGGGIYSLFDSYVTIINSTLAENTASFRGDAFANDFSFPPTFANTLIVGDCAILSNIPISHGGNIESPGYTCYLQHPTDRANVADPGIAPLSDNGGSTFTHALLPGSPAIDTAINGRCPATDQRGIGRPVDGDGDGVATCDVGAFELHPKPLVVDIPALSPAGFAAFAILLAAVSLFAIRRAQNEERRAGGGSGSLMRISSASRAPERRG